MKLIEHALVNTTELAAFFGQPESEDISQLISELISVLKSDEENFEEIEYFGLMKVGDRYYSFKLTEFTVSIVSLLLDIFITQGAVSTVLTGTGALKQFIYSVPSDNGELCNYFKLTKLNRNAVSLANLTSSYKNYKCPFLPFKCKFEKKGKCTIDNVHIVENLKALNKKGVVFKFDDKTIIINAQ